MSIPVLVLAGGEGRRMGGADKPLLELGGRPVLRHMLERLSPAHGPFAISANGDPARYAAFGFPVLADPPAFRGCGPLAGLLAGLAWAEALGAAALLTVPGDAPFLPPDLAARLAPAPALAESGGKRHPPVALWPVATRAALAAHLEALDRDRRGAWSVLAFADAIGARVVGFPAAPFDPFLDIDTPADLARAQALHAGALHGGALHGGAPAGC